MIVECVYDITFDFDREVVIGPVLFMFIIERAPGVAPSMARVVSPSVAQIDSTAKPDLAVDEDHFLVVGGAQGVQAIKNKVHAFMNAAPNSSLKLLPFKRVERSVVPKQQVGAKVRVLTADPPDLVKELFAFSIGSRERVA